MRDQAGGVLWLSPSYTVTKLLDFWTAGSYMGKWLQGTLVILRPSVRLLLAHEEGPPPANRATLQRVTPCPNPSDATEPMCILGWKPSISDISLVIVLFSCWFLGATSSCQAQHILHNTIDHHATWEVLGIQLDKQRSDMKKGRQVPVLLAPQQDRTFFF